MRKSILIFLFFMVIMFVGINGVSALECYYDRGLILSEVKNGTITNIILTKDNPSQQPYYSLKDPEYWNVIRAAGRECPSELYTVVINYSPQVYDVYLEKPATYSEVISNNQTKSMWCYYTNCDDEKYSVYFSGDNDVTVYSTGGTRRKIDNANVTYDAYAKCSKFLVVSGNDFELSDTKNSEFSLPSSCSGGGQVVSCYNINNIPRRLPKITSTIVDIIKVVIPVGLIILGMMDITKAVMAQKEDEIKKGQRIFIKRLAVAVLVFFVFVIVEMIVRIVAGSEGSSIVDCMNCFLNNKC